MGEFVGTFTEVNEIPPPRQIQVITRRKYIKNLEDGKINIYKEYSVFTIDEKTGSLTAQTEYGDFSYTWRSIGSQTFSEFLCDLDMDYFMNKAAKQPYKRIDTESIIKNFKVLIIDCRKQEDINKYEAREMWEEVESLEASSEGDIYSWYGEQTEIHKIIEPMDIPIYSVTTESSQYFWDVIWKAFTDYLRQGAKA